MMGNKFLRSILEKIDIYPTSFTFHWGPFKPFFKSNIGGLFTIFTLVAILYFIWISGNDIIYKADPKVLIDNSKWINRPKKVINKGDFSFGLAIEKGNGNRIIYDLGF